MLDISIGSGVFALILILAPFLLNKSEYRNYIFLFLNILVYAISGITSPLQLLVFLIWIFVPYFAITKLYQKKYTKTILVILMVACFCYLMQYDWIFKRAGIPYAFLFKILGLSYFLFRQIDYIMQYEYLLESNVKLSLIDYINYLLSFYTLLAGPILRYEAFVTDFYEEKAKLEKDEVLALINRAVNGYIKVYVISSILMYYAKFYFEGLGKHSNIVFEIAAFVIFALFNGWYIYFNFSGYCDVVISFAKLSGLTVAENFNRPYLSRSVVEFWNRHHITLSEWIRDYIYSPLFKSFLSGPLKKNMKLAQYISLFVTFVIAGVWHGTTVNYLIYGLFQGLGIVVATIFKAWLKKKLGKKKFKEYEKNKWIGIVEMCVTWTYICLTFSFVGFDVAGLLFK